MYIKYLALRVCMSRLKPLPHPRDYFANETTFQRDLNQVRAENFRVQREYDYMAVNRDISASNYRRWGMDRPEERAESEYAFERQAFERQEAVIY
jgi:hypothetical protein